MTNTALTISLVIALVLSSATDAHQLSKKEVLAMFNRNDVKQHTGIEEATVATTLNRMLVIKIGPRWYKQAALDRKRWAHLWLKMWVNSFPTGTVAIVDSVTGKPVVNFHPTGQISLSVR